MFNPSQHIMKIKSKDYLPVQWRLVWFRDVCPQGTIHTEMIHLDIEKGFCVFRATIANEEGGSATGTKQESIRDFPDYIEKAETGAIGRALAALGYGTQFVGDEFDEATRIVDAPAVLPAQTPVAPSPCKVEAPQEETGPSLEQIENDTPCKVSATDEQKCAIIRLCKRAKSDPPRNINGLSRDEARDWIVLLQSKQQKAPDMMNAALTKSNKAFSVI